MLQKILIAIGDASESEKIRDSGLDLAEKLSAEVLMLHVLNPSHNGFELVGNPLMGGMSPLVSDLAVQQYQQDWQAYERLGLERLQEYDRQAKNRHLKVEILQKFGDSGQMICETAKSAEIDLVVMGRNQKSVLSELFLGSTSNYVVHHAPCSVLVIQHT
jgi:nucleotide-binding universal stress UspA family protein